MNDLKMDWLNAVKTASDEERQAVTLDEHSHTVQSLTTLEYRIEKSNILQRHNEAMGILE